MTQRHTKTSPGQPATISSTGTDSSQVFRRASLLGDEQTVLDLLKLGIDIDTPDTYGRTALIEAAFGGRPRVVKILISNGANPNAADKDGWTALMEAASKGCHECVQTLLEARAKTTQQTKMGLTALDLTAKGHLNIIRLLRTAAESELNT